MREKLIDLIVEKLPDDVPIDLLQDVDAIVDAILANDVVEVRHGSFTWIADDSPMCNICGKVFDTNDNADAGLWKFCPNCGAKMGGGERNER